MITCRRSYCVISLLVLTISSLTLFHLLHLRQKNSLAQIFTPDLNRTIYLPWSKFEPECRNFTITFLQRHESKSIVALASYPGSGNTWTRYLIESITGIFTGNIWHVIRFVVTYS